MSSSGVAPIRSVQRAAKVLELFEGGRSDLNLSEITRMLGFTRPTAHRYCMALRAVGLLRYAPDTGTYGLGSRLIELGAVALQAYPVVIKADPYLHELVERVKHTAVMTVWDSFAPVVARVNDNTGGNVRISVRVGTRLPLLESAQGSIYLAYSASIRDQFERTVTGDSLGDDLGKVRARGYSVHSLTAGMLTVAVPVFSRGAVVATIASIGTSAEMSDKIKMLAKELKRTAERLRQALEQEEAA